MRILRSQAQHPQQRDCNAAAVVGCWEACTMLGQMPAQCKDANARKISGRLLVGLRATQGIIASSMHGNTAWMRLSSAALVRTFTSAIHTLYATCVLKITELISSQPANLKKSSFWGNKCPEGTASRAAHRCLSQKSGRNQAEQGQSASVLNQISDVLQIARDFRRRLERPCVSHQRFNPSGPAPLRCRLLFASAPSSHARMHAQLHASQQRLEKPCLSAASGNLQQVSSVMLRTQPLPAASATCMQFAAAGTG